MIRRYNFRIYPTVRQQKFFAVQFGCYRWVYNYFLERRREAYDNRGEKLRYCACCKELTYLKNVEELMWLKDASEEVLQGAVRAIDKAFVRFFKKQANYPIFKRKKGRQSFTGAAHYIKFSNSRVCLPKAGWVKLRLTKDVSEWKPLSYTIIKDIAGKWTLSIAFQLPDLSISSVAPVSGAGLDYSSKNLFVDNQGNKGKLVSFISNFSSRISKERRKLSRMLQGGSNYEKQRKKVGKYIRKLVNTRIDYLHKKSTELATAYDFIAVEDLNIQELIDTANGLCIVRSTIDNSYGTFVRMLEYKLAQRGKQLVRVGKYFPSTQLCSVCGYKNSLLTLDDREWVCPVCRTFHDRDVNAARNILVEGSRIIRTAATAGIAR